MKKIRTLVALILLLSSLARGEELRISKEIYKTESEAFLAYDKPTQWGSWLQMSVPYAPARKLTEEIEKVTGTKLKNRGEAHITVVTPVEYWNVLKPAGLMMSEINQVALSAKIQSARFEVICVGRGSKLLENKQEYTYFVVVQSVDLVEIRKEIKKLFLAKGGRSQDFDAERYYPHITLGFTQRDLHESDGIIKDRKSCWRKLLTRSL
jgi:hypothetical protein